MFAFFVLTPLFIPQNVLGAEWLGKECLNNDGIRELDFRYTVGVQEFDELNKIVYVTIDLDVEDEDEQTEPFDVFHRRYPYLGSTVVHIIPKDDIGYYETQANTKFHERRITPILNFPINPWPFETYKIPMFLEFDRDVMLCFDTWDDGSKDVSVYKAGHFPENPNWQVEITPYETSFEEIEKLVPEIKPKFENSTIFQFDTVISHTENYKKKIGVYFFLILAPIILMIGHLLWIRFEKLNSHITFFAGVSILILTSIVALGELTPIDLTLFEIISISSVIGYAIGFFIFLANRKSRDSNNEVFNTNNKVKKKTSVYRDKVWKKFTIVFGVLMGFLVSAFILASWGDSTPITAKISNVASIFGVFLAMYIAVWVYKVEMNKKDEKEKENEYYKININDSFYKLGLKMQDIFKPNEEKMKESEKANICKKITDRIKENRGDILQICSELQIFNLNSHIPADAKDETYVIIKQSKEAISSMPMPETLSSHYKVVNDVLSRMEKFLTSEYMSDLEELRKKYSTTNDSSKLAS